jgi:hypothetical protein
MFVMLFQVSILDMPPSQYAKDAIKKFVNYVAKARRPIQKRFATIVI